MLVSVVLNCLNGERFLKRSIESVLNQTSDILEIVFIDNGSTDLSAHIAKGYGPKISYYKNDKTVPLGKARHQGIMLSKGDLIAFIDADDEWEKDKIARQIILMNNQVSFVFSNTKMSGGQGRDFFLFDYFSPNLDDIFNSILEKDFIATSSVIFKKSLYTNSNQKYNCNLTIECDRDLFIRLAGECKMDYVADFLVTRYLYNTSTSFRKNTNSILELQSLEESINNYCRNQNDNASSSLPIFNSRLNILKGRHFWQLGDLYNARLSFSKSNEKKANLMLILSYIYPFKSSLKPLIIMLRYSKFLSNLVRK